MDKEETHKRILWLMDEIRPLTQHNDIGVYPLAYSPKEDALCLDIVPRSSPEWAKIAYKFAHHPGVNTTRTRVFTASTANLGAAIRVRYGLGSCLISWTAQRSFSMSGASSLPTRMPKSSSGNSMVGSWFTTCLSRLMISRAICSEGSFLRKNLPSLPRSQKLEKGSVPSNSAHISHLQARGKPFLIFRSFFPLPG